VLESFKTKNRMKAEIKQLIITYECILNDKIFFLEKYKNLINTEYIRILAEMRIFKMIIEDLKKIK
tara:strand:- start:426 stop:623 length:198 start_codon:yes stop_codon:yes gene_type:complete